MNRAPCFQFFPRDWLDFKVQRMSLTAQGAYLKILCFMWADSKDQCSIADDNSLLAKGLGTTVDEWLELRREIQHESEPIFEQKEGRFVSARLRAEAERQRKYRKSQAEKGKQSAQQRLSRGSTVVEPEYQPNGNSSSSSSKKKKNPPKVPLNGGPSGFEIFWKNYPRKEGKGRAEKAWKKIQPDDFLVGKMLAKIEQAKQTPQWNKAREYVPLPSTWLNDRGWESEYHPHPNGDRSKPRVAL